MPLEWDSPRERQGEVPPEWDSPWERQGRCPKSGTHLGRGRGGAPGVGLTSGEAGGGASRVGRHGALGTVLLQRAVPTASLQRQHRENDWLCAQTFKESLATTPGTTSVFNQTRTRGSVDTRQAGHKSACQAPRECTGESSSQERFRDARSTFRTRNRGLYQACVTLDEPCVASVHVLRALSYRLECRTRRNQ